MTKRPVDCLIRRAFLFASQRTNPAGVSSGKNRKDAAASASSEMKPQAALGWRRFPWEAAFWILALLYLALLEPASESHFTLCPLKMLGVNFCPGCNIGHSIAFLLHGDIQQSWNAHWLGIPAVLLLGSRSGILFCRYFENLYATRTKNWKW